MSKRLAFWLLLLSLALAVGAGGTWARDHYGTPRPCAQCKRSVRTWVGVEVPLHKGCRARYADAQIENRVFEFTATREQVMATKTQVVDGVVHLSGTLGVYSQTVYPILISAPTKLISFSAGGMSFNIEDISTSGWPQPPYPAPGPSPPPGTVLTFAIYIVNSNVMPSVVAHEFAYISGAGDDDVERAFDLTITGQRIWRTETTNYGAGRDGKPVFADDVDYADEWRLQTPRSVLATFGSLSYSGVPNAAVGGITIVFNQHKGQTSAGIYAAARELQWSAVDINFAGMSKTYGVAPPGVGGKVTGGVGSLELIYNDTANRISTWFHGLPYILDFSATSIRNRQGALLTDARLAGPWRCSDEVPDSRNWSTTP